MSGKAFHRIEFFGSFVKLVYNICKNTAAGGEHAIGHISSKFFIRF